ncbi:acetylglutamate kinase [Roseivirga sp.]|uniref:acetylglutamate kinase n=1 Tax=Roseivirga sp. TaxID=1964215 RepID=UPI003B52673A
MNKLTIIKIGGNVIDDPKSLDLFLADFAKRTEPTILVHGGGKIATQIGNQLGIEARMVDGRRITDAETLDLVTMVYGGLVNKKIVAQLQANGINAIGLTGADGNSMLAKKRPVKEIDYGFVGDVVPEGVNINLLVSLLNQGIRPVFCALTHDGQGNMLNTNADTIASVLAVALSKSFDVELVYCFEQPGVLSDFESKTVIPVLDPDNYHEYKNSGIINSGMIPKLDNAFDALNAGVGQVRIIHFSSLNNNQSGTIIQL